MVQGPLISTRRNGDGSDRPFDCREAVLSHLDQADGLFDLVVLSTWEGVHTDWIAAIASRPGIELVLSSDPGQPPDDLGHLGDNRLRQAVATRQGIRRAIQLGADRQSFVAKVRTDQTLDLRELVASSRRLQRENVPWCDWVDPIPQVFVPYIFANEIWSIADYYMAGSLAAMYAMFDGGARLHRLVAGSRSVHVDLAQKYLISWGAQVPWEAWKTLAVVPAGRKWRSGSRLPFPLAHAKRWADITPMIFTPMSRQIISSGSWRGDPFPELYSGLESNVVPIPLFEETMPRERDARLRLFVEKATVEFSDYSWNGLVSTSRLFHCTESLPTFTGEFPKAITRAIWLGRLLALGAADVSLISERLRRHPR